MGSEIRKKLYAAGREERRIMIIETRRLRMRPSTDAEMEPYLAMAPIPR